MQNANRRILGTITVACALGACALDADLELEDEAPAESQTAQDINTNNIVTQWSWLRRTVTLGNCTGVIIGQRHVATAAHCKPRRGNWVGFYGPDGSVTSSGTIAGVYERYGVDDLNNDWHDRDGNWADLAVLRLVDDIPSTHTFARLASSYPGSGYDVWKVGSGRHNSQDNNTAQLRWARDTTRSSSDGDGAIRTQNHDVNSGDSGGPLFGKMGDDFPLTVHGVLWGYLWDVGAARYVDRYTSLRFHFSAIMAAMGERGRVTGRVFNGTVYSSSTKSLWECAASCMQSSRCEAYRHRLDTHACLLLDKTDGTSVASSSSYRSGYKYLFPCYSQNGGICRMDAEQVRY